MLSLPCETCAGQGMVGAGRQIGPCEHAREERCHDCDGEGTQPILCWSCGRPAVRLDDDGFGVCDGPCAALDAAS